MPLSNALWVKSLSSILEISERIFYLTVLEAVETALLLSHEFGQVFDCYVDENGTAVAM